MYNFFENQSLQMGSHAFQAHSLKAGKGYWIPDHNMEWALSNLLWNRNYMMCESIWYECSSNLFFATEGRPPKAPTCLFRLFLLTSNFFFFNNHHFYQFRTYPILTNWRPCHPPHSVMVDRALLGSYTSRLYPAQEL